MTETDSDEFLKQIMFLNMLHNMNDSQSDPSAVSDNESDYSLDSHECCPTDTKKSSGPVSESGIFSSDILQAINLIIF